MPRPALRSLPGTLAKTAFGIGVFASTVAAWGWVGPYLNAHRPLPGGAGPEGRCAIWFVGSSSIHRWQTMAADMAPWQVHNRGVNGALLGEVTARFLNEAPAQAPGAIVFYVGENDIAAGAGAGAAAGSVAHLVRDAHRRMPGTHLFVIGLKPSPARWAQRPDQRRFNAIARAAAARDGATFLDIGDVLLTHGTPGAFYQEDGIHLDPAGYVRWGGAVREGIERHLPASTVRSCTAPHGTGA